MRTTSTSTRARRSEQAHRAADAASHDATAVPSGGVLVPFVGVGGHCLPKDGILFWWRKIESGADTSKSLILESRKINDASPAETTRIAEKQIGSITGKKVAILGSAYRFDSEDTRNAPTLYLAKLLLERGVSVQDPRSVCEGRRPEPRAFRAAEVLHQRPRRRGGRCGRAVLLHRPPGLQERPQGHPRQGAEGHHGHRRSEPLQGRGLRGHEGEVRRHRPRHQGADAPSSSTSSRSRSSRWRRARPTK